MSHSKLAAIVIAAVALGVSGCGGSSKTGSTTTVASTPTQTTTAQTTSTQTTTAQTSSTTTTPVLPSTGEPIKIKSGTPLTRRVLIAKAEPICERANTELDSTKIKSIEDYARVLPQTASYDRIEANELSKLVPPAAMAKAWTEIVTDLQKFGEYTEMVAEYAQAKKFTTAVPIFTAGRATHEKLAGIAKRNGFKECAVI
jgi:hypothetical protein